VTVAAQLADVIAYILMDSRRQRGRRSNVCDLWRKVSSMEFRSFYSEMRGDKSHHVRADKRPTGGSFRSRSPCKGNSACLNSIISDRCSFNTDIPPVLHEGILVVIVPGVAEVRQAHPAPTLAPVLTRLFISLTVSGTMKLGLSLARFRNRTPGPFPKKEGGRGSLARTTSPSFLGLS